MQVTINGRRASRWHALWLVPTVTIATLLICFVACLPWLVLLAGAILTLRWTGVIP